MTLETAPRETLSVQIAHLIDKMEVPPPLQATIDQALARLEAEGLAPGIAVGERVHDFTLPNALGLDVSLRERLRLGPVVLTFYRGEWCPICNAQLKAYQEILPEIRGRGASLVAVSPQWPDESLSLMDKLQLEYDLLSDESQEVIRDYRLQFTVPDEIKQAHLDFFKVDVAEHNANRQWTLPAPATHILDGGGVVRARHVSVDHRKRMEPTDVLRALDALRR